MPVELTAATWSYLVFIILILATMVFRKNIVVPAVMGTFVVALIYSSSLVTGIAAIFNASLVAAVNLFNIFLIIALVTAMLGALQEMGADRKMVTPFRGIMRNSHLAFWTLAVVTYFISLFFWPTPAVPLIGAVLIPVAIRAGLPAMSIGLVVAIAGQGMALSSDFIIRVAPGLSAKAAGVDPDVVADRALILSVIVGGIALVMAYFIDFRKMRAPSAELLDVWERSGESGIVEENEEIAQSTGTFHDQEMLEGASGAAMHGGTALLTRPAGGGGDGRGASDGADPTVGHGVSLRGTPAAGSGSPAPRKNISSGLSSAFAIIVPAAYLLLIIYLIVAKVSPDVPDLKGGDAAALVGGIATLLLFAATVAKDGRNCLETSAAHVVDGLVFAFKAMGVVLPIAGFFFLGNGDFSAAILGLGPDEKAPAFLYDLVNAAQSHIPTTPMIAGFGLLLIGMVAGLEGSGFSGLPLTGSLAQSLGPASGASSATLATIGQMGNIWSGGGTLVAWSSLLAVAGFARVSVVELARKAFIPVVTGLIVATIFGILVFRT